MRRAIRILAILIPMILALAGGVLSFLVLAPIGTLPSVAPAPTDSYAAVMTRNDVIYPQLFDRILGHPFEGTISVQNRQMRA